jgi:hypothetical protein
VRTKGWEQAAAWITAPRLATHARKLQCGDKVQGKKQEAGQRHSGEPRTGCCYTREGPLWAALLGAVEMRCMQTYKSEGGGGACQKQRK